MPLVAWTPRKTYDTVIAYMLRYFKTQQAFFYSVRLIYFKLIVETNLAFIQTFEQNYEIRQTVVSGMVDY